MTARLPAFDFAAEVRRANAARLASEGIDITFLLRKDCANCGDDTRPLAREWGGKRLLCPKCRESAWEREQEYQQEERDRARFEFRQRTRL